LAKLADLIFKFRFNADQRGQFYEAIANFTADGIPLYDCLQDMLAALKEESSYLVPMLKVVIGRMRGRDGGAEDFGAALVGFSPEMETALISAGERSGDVAIGLRKAQHVALSQKEIGATVRGAMLQPAIYILMLAGVLLALSKGILPAMEAGVARESWPVYARALGALADATIPLLLTLLVLIILWGIAFFVTAGNLVGSVRKGLDKWLFPWGIYASINESVMLLTISAMVRVGLPFETAIDSTQKRGSRYLSDKLARTRRALKEGSPPGEALVKSVNDGSMRWQILMYAKTSEFAPGLEKLANRGIENLLKGTKAKFAFAGFLVLALVALMILWVFGSFFGVSMSIRASMPS